MAISTCIKCGFGNYDMPLEPQWQSVHSDWRTESIRSYKYYKYYMSLVSGPLCSRTLSWSAWSIQWHGPWLHLQAEQLHPDPPELLRMGTTLITFLSNRTKKSKTKGEFILSTTKTSPPLMKVWPRRLSALLTNSHLEVDLSLRFVWHVSNSWWPENIL